jgi:hypothetical protein
MRRALPTKYDVIIVLARGQVAILTLKHSALFFIIMEKVHEGNYPQNRIIVHQVRFEVVSLVGK